ncbi:MAG: hypothetical protein J6328_07435 [Bacilli bacterium]|nr:hypothetical protein [Bacilli bacterium]
MDVKNTYPIGKPKSHFWRLFCQILTLLFLISAPICVLVNVFYGSTQWSIIVVLAEYFIWASFLNPAPYNLNLISQFIKLLISILILLIAVEVFIRGGWGLFVIPIVCWGGLIVIGVLFLSDFRRQKHQSIPFLLFILICLAFGISGIFASFAETKWVYIVLASVALAWLIVCIVLLNKTIVSDFKKKINTR